MRIPVQILAAIFVSSAVSGFEIKRISYNSMEVKLGAPLRLKCKTDTWFEYCIWRHKDRVCEFEWKYYDKKVMKQVTSRSK